MQRNGMPLTGFGASAATVERRSSSVLTPSMKHTSAPASAASFRRVTASSMPKTCAESVRPMMTCDEKMLGHVGKVK